MIYAFLERLSALWEPLGGLSSVAARSGLAALISFAFSIWMGPRLLRFLNRRQVLEITDQTESETLNEINRAKPRTPTMGGVMIVAAVIVSGLICGRLDNPYVKLAILSTVGYGLIGMIDDWVKLTHPGRKGLQAATKAALQLLIAMALAFVVTRILQRAEATELLRLNVPFSGGLWFDLSGYGGVPHMILVMVVVIGTSNAVNLTDGMDGLAPGALIIAALAMGALAYAVGRAEFLFEPDDFGRTPLLSIAGADEMTVFCSAMAGAGLGFLWFNAPPALVYMGDTGSLPLGSLLGYVAVITKHELVLLIIGGVFVVEALSVIAQVGYFKASGGKRVLRCAPLHHHFQFGGMPDTRIVVRFWILGALCAAVGLASLAVQ